VLLNKYPVIPRHLLVVTRDFVEQELPLGPEDFEALWLCLLQDEEPRSLGFYNSSPDAGASQRHRHLQVVALPIGGADQGTPLHAAFERAGARPGSLAELPFAHAAVRFEAPNRADAGWYAAATLDHYRRALEAVGRDPARPGAYNLLVTRRFLCVVPRRREKFGPVSVNALGFCGVLLARGHRELEWLRDAGPMTALREVAG
jgi:ATP adenylyltransferase